MKEIDNQKGFSLIEMLIAITIFAIGLLAVAGMQTTSVRGNADSRFISEATSLGQGQIEKLLSLSYDHADLNPANSPRSLIDGFYTYTWSVTEDNLLPNTKTIFLDIIYSARGVNKQTRIIAAKADVI